MPWAYVSIDMFIDISFNAFFVLIIVLRNFSRVLDWMELNVIGCFYTFIHNQYKIHGHIESVSVSVCGVNVNDEKEMARKEKTKQ